MSPQCKKHLFEMVVSQYKCDVGQDTPIATLLVFAMKIRSNKSALCYEKKAKYIISAVAFLLLNKSKTMLNNKYCEHTKDEAYSR